MTYRPPPDPFQSLAGMRNYRYDLQYRHVSYDVVEPNGT